MSLTSWFLVSSGGTRHRLPREMIFVGRDDCELMLQMAKVCKVLPIRSRSVDKQHAVVNYNAAEDEHKVKDLGSLNGTFVNEVRIPEQTYITLKIDDKLRFGYDTNLFTVARGELRVPEEALKHEKFTSQLQLPQKPPEAEGSKEAPDGSVEAKAELMASVVEMHKASVDISALPVARGTPLYGQPAWWGEDDADDENSSKQDPKPRSVKMESSATGGGSPSEDAKEVSKPGNDSKDLGEEVIYPLCREPSYFEIPTKEFHQPALAVESSIHEIPTKDTETSRAVVQGHASFTIEFDDHTPGKVTIKDHVTKFTPDQRHKQKKSPPATKELSGLQAAMKAAESKVADWLAQNDPPRMRRESMDDDCKSIKSDLTVQMRRLKGSKHDDGTQSDTENGNGQRRAHKPASLEGQLRMYRAEQQRLHHQKTATSEKAHEVPSMSRTAFMIEFFDEDNPRKRRSYSFTQIAAAIPQEGPHPFPPAKPDRPKGIAAESKTTSLTHQPSPLHAKSSHSVHELHQTKHLQKHKPDVPSVPLVSAQITQLRSSGSTGHRQNYSQQLEQQIISPAATKENDDDQSDKGTYTIELENSNTEEEEARRMIDTVFGVVDSPNYSGCGITRPVIAEQKIKWQPNSTEQATDARNGELSKELLNDSETRQEGSFTSSSPRWLSQWANLAANDLTPTTFGAHDQDADISESGISAKSASTTSETASASVGERKRRTLPQLPTEDKTAEGLRSKGSLTLNLAKPRREIDEKQDTELPEKETTTPPHQKDKQKEHIRSFSKTGRSKGGSAIKADGAGDICSETMNSKEGVVFQSSSYTQPTKAKAETLKGISAARQSSPTTQQQYQRSSSKTTSASKPLVNSTNLVDKSREVSPRQVASQKANDVRESRQAIAISTLDKAEVQPEAKQKKSEESVRRHASKGGDTEKKDSPRPLVRQGSFTIEKPSSNVPLELIPRISRQSGSPGDASTRSGERSNSNGTDSTIDTTILLKDTESVMAFLEAKLKDENRVDGGDETPSYHRDDSISPESDVDTASTISLVSGDAEKKSLQKRRTLSNLHKEKSFTKSPKDSSKTTVTNARDKLADRKIKGRASDLSIRSEPRKPVQPTGRARQASFDLTDDDQTSSFPQSTISDFLSSDQEAYSSRSQGRTSFTSTDDLLHSKLEGNKLSKTKTTAIGSASKSTTLPKPRPTRASILRRARLGDVSDNELADVDKVSVVSEVSTTSSTTSKPPSGRKTPSRLDLLAQPRRNRLGSISARSDSEATITRSNVNRSGDFSIRSNLRGTSAIDSKVSPRLRANSISRMPDSSKAKASIAGHGSPSGPRWRRFPTDYASTSEDEFGSNRSSPKHSRLRTSTALRSAKLPNSNVTSSTNMLLKNKMKEQDDYIRDWTAHSEEIARYLSISKISQDLAKDLAILAREIHDVAGEIDSVSSSGTAPSTTVSTAATTPGSTIDTREEVGDLHEGMPKLVDRVFDESLNFRKIPPVPCIKLPAGNGRPSDSRSRILEVADQATKRKTWSRDEAVLDSLMLTSVSQLSQKIRHAMEKTALKIRILFKNEDRNWEEIENKMRSESEVPILKTSNKEISSILQELKKVEKQLQAISVMIDPDGALDSACGLKLSSPSLPEQAKHKTSSTRSLQITASNSDYSNHFSQYEHNGEDKDNSLHE
ncbi:centrosomal protein of 170 kDa-like isoform X3 [Carcharodon carcharias]|uniref:centrosomal protein of 170 kDa-like isoform X3 n=1 Tax=Carcharodon carcharias TaxID=13397 RepID=UPI001B7ED8E2|nr:centrosomal protein of 170 kDa-like isoform X3 [Carcharodon carcharias]